MAEEAVYVYAIGKAELTQDPAIGDLTGVANAAVRVVVAGELAAAVSAVDAVAFDEEALRRNLEDLAWVEATARAHHSVVDTIGRSHPIAPVRMATIYVDESAVRALLDENAEGFARALNRIDGRTEWGVKAFRVAEPEPEAGSAPGAAEDAARPGTAYLLRRRAARERAATARGRSVETVEQVHDALSRHAVAGRRYPPQDPRLTGRQDEMLLNAAYLVDERDVDEFGRTVRAWDGRGVRLELTGPWPPYSFATLDEP